MPKYALKGVPDLIVFKPHAVVFLEVKRPGGALSESQIAFQNACIGHDIEYHVVQSVDDVVKLGL